MTRADSKLTAYRPELRNIPAGGADGVIVRRGVRAHEICGLENARFSRVFDRINGRQLDKKSSFHPLALPAAFTYDYK